jgi:hypothetical protein
MNDPNLKNSNLNLVKMSKSVKCITAKQDLVNDIIIVMRNMSSLNELKESNLFELVKSVCVLIENGDYKTKNPSLKLNKKDIAIQALVTLFPDLNNDKEKKYLSQSIDIFCESKIIKKITTSRYLKKVVVPFFKKKFL